MLMCKSAAQVPVVQYLHECSEGINGLNHDLWAFVTHLAHLAQVVRAGRVVGDNILSGLRRRLCLGQPQWTFRGNDTLQYPPINVGVSQNRGTPLLPQIESNPLKGIPKKGSPMFGNPPPPCTFKKRAPVVEGNALGCSEPFTSSPQQGL